MIKNDVLIESTHKKNLVLSSDFELDGFHSLSLSSSETEFYPKLPRILYLLLTQVFQKYLNPDFKLNSLKKTCVWLSSTP